MRQKIAYICFHLSSLFKLLGKLARSKRKTIVADMLSLPGWFVLDECIIHQTPLKDKKIVGFQWDYWPMPEPWVKEMRGLKMQSEKHR